MTIRVFKDGKEIEIYNNLPPIDLIKRSEIDFFNICDEYKRCIVLFDFNTTTMYNWINNTSQINKSNAEVNVTTLITDKPSKYNRLYNLVNTKYEVKVNELGVINIMDIYRNVIPKNEKDKLPITFKSFHDKYRIGLALIVATKDNNLENKHIYNFVSSITANKLNLINLRTKLKKWINDTRKMHIFINKRKNKILEFNDFIHVLADTFNIGLNHVFHKSHFQHVRTFINHLNINRFNDLYINNANGERYNRIWNDFDSIKQVAPVYNFKGIRLQFVQHMLSVTLLGTSIKISKKTDESFSAILAILDMIGQLGQLEDQLERTKLINA